MTTIRKPKVPARKKAHPRWEEAQGVLREDQVLELFMQGKTTKEIAKALGKSVATIQSDIDNIMQGLGESIIDRAEGIVIKNFLRLEEAISKVRPHALGLPTEDEILAAIEEDTPLSKYPDRHLLPSYFRAIQMQLDVAEKIIGRTDKPDTSAVTIENVSVTFTNKSGLYMKAQEEAENEWMGFSDESIENLLDAPDETPVPIITDQEKRLQEIEKTIKNLVPDDEEDEEDTP